MPGLDISTEHEHLLTELTELTDAAVQLIHTRHIQGEPMQQVVDEVLAAMFGADASNADGELTLRGVGELDQLAAAVVDIISGNEFRRR